MARKHIAHNSLLPIYLAWQLNPANANYNLCFSYKLKNLEEINLLIKKLQELISLKAYLRQTFSFENETLITNLHDKLPAKVIFHKCTMTELPILEKTLTNETHNLNRDSPIKLNIIDLFASGYVALFNIHHIIMDGVTLDNFINDLNHLLSDKKLEKETINGYISRLIEENPLKKNSSDKNLISYISNITNIADQLTYPKEDSHPEIFHHQATMPLRLLNKLNNFSTTHGVSEFNLLLTGFGIYMAKIFNQHQMLIDYPVNIRVDKKIDGCFLNIVTLPIHFTSEDTYLSLIDNWKKLFGTLKYAKNFIPDRKSNLGAIPNFSESGIACPQNLCINNVSYHPKSYSQIANGSISFKFRRKKEKLYIVCDTLANIFPQYVSSLLLKRFFNFLEKLLCTPSLSLTSIDLIFDKEKKHILHVLNNTDVFYQKNKSLIELIEETILKFPNKMAVTAYNGKLSYAELNEKSESLANYLIENGLTLKDRVGILIDNRLEMISCVLAALKTGAAYVPIAHDIPLERIRDIIQDSDISFLLTVKEFAHIDNIKAKVVDVNTELKSNFSRKKPLLAPDAIACIVYTSGTTGRPKGVMMTNAALVNVAQYYIQKFEITNQTNCSKYAGFGFDASLIEILPALLAGATLCIIPDNDKRNLLAIKNFYNENRIHFGFLPTQLAELFLDDPSDYLNNLVVAGEKLYKYHPVNFNVINAYGTTETSVHATSFLLDKEILNIPIGKPINNVKCYVADNDLNLLPIGMVGELLIGGECLSKGYLNLEELTKEKFIPNIYQTPEEKTQHKNQRLYKTGDLVRWLPDGNLEYISRNDFQIKICGHRIEIEEIEFQLRRINEIDQALVVSFENSKKGKYLCAYYTSKHKLDQEIIKKKLSDTLVGHMLPNYFIWLDKFPINANGKIDKKLLPSPNLSDAFKAYNFPKNEQEKLVCNIFSEVLEVEKIGIHDDFFSLGGSSIEAITLVSKLQNYFNINITDIFNFKTPKKLIENISYLPTNFKKRLEEIKSDFKLNGFSKNNEKIKIKRGIYINSIKNIKSAYDKKNISTILLTGSTGFLGCNILNKILTSTDYKIFLLIRSTSDEEAFDRINKKYLFYFNRDLRNFYNSRVFVFKADIQKSRLGLSIENYNSLTKKIHSIIHCAALTKHYGEYTKFYSTNVKATVNLLEFCKMTKLKDFHYISTKSVLTEGCVSNCKEYIFTEDNLGRDLEKRFNFYVKTKYEGEQSVLEYRKYGINSSIYRVGNLALMASNSHTQENIEENAFFNRYKCLLQLGITYEDLQQEEISPVDLTAEAIIKLFDIKQISNSIHHVFNPYLCNMPAFFNKAGLTKLQILPVSEFIDAIANLLDNKRHQKLIQRFLLHQGWLENKYKHSTSSIQVLQNRTNAILAQLGFKWPIITQDMLREFIEKATLQ